MRSEPAQALKDIHDNTQLALQFVATARQRALLYWSGLCFNQSAGAPVFPCAKEDAGAKHRPFSPLVAFPEAKNMRKNGY